MSRETYSLAKLGACRNHELLEILADPKHSEHESMKEWLGHDFDPTRFNLELANGLLDRLKA